MGCDFGTQLLQLGGTTQNLGEGGAFCCDWSCGEGEQAEREGRRRPCASGKWRIERYVDGGLLCAALRWSCDLLSRAVAIDGVEEGIGQGLNGVTRAWLADGILKLDVKTPGRQSLFFSRHYALVSSSSSPHFYRQDPVRLHCLGICCPGVRWSPF